MASTKPTTGPQANLQPESLQALTPKIGFVRANLKLASNPPPSRPNRDTIVRNPNLMEAVMSAPPCLALLLAIAALLPAQPALYQDPAAPIEKRVDDLVA